MAREILDVRDLAREWRELLEADESESGFACYLDLCNELNVDPTPDALEDFGDSFEPTLIHDGHFTQYAQELAEEIGAVPSDLLWPLRCIDWDAAADELQVDYLQVRYNGEIYYIRSW